MRLLLVHSHSLDRLGGAELDLKRYMAAAPSGVDLDVVLPDEPVQVSDYDTVVLANLRPEGGLGEAEECRSAREWMKRVRGYTGYLVRMEMDSHPCTYRDARCIDFSASSWRKCNCRSPIRRTFQGLYNLCDTTLYMSPLHRRVINHIIKVKGSRQVEIGSPVDLVRFRSVIPFEERKHAALITGDAARVAPHAEALAGAEGYPVEFVDYLSVPHAEMPELLNRYKAVVIAPSILHAGGRLAVEAMACGCQVIANERVGAMSWPDLLSSSQDALDTFWEVVAARPARPNPRRFGGLYILGAGSRLLERAASALNPLNELREVRRRGRR